MQVLKRFAKTVTAVAASVAVLVSTCVPTYAAGKHTVTFLYGTKSYVTTVDDGCSVLPPSDTYVPGYIFAGWVGNATNVTSDQTILGAYVKVDQTPQPAPDQQQQQQQTRTYRVRFVDSLTGNEYYSEDVREGGDANPPEVPHHDGYHFHEYNGSYTNVTSDCTITAMYDLDFDCYHDEPSEWWWWYMYNQANNGGGGDDGGDDGGNDDYWWL